MNGSEQDALQRVVEMARGLPIWVKMLRFSNLAAAIIMAFWIWKTGPCGHRGMNLFLFALGLILVALTNVEIWIYTGQLDLIGLLAFIPLIYFGAKTFSGGS